MVTKKTKRKTKYVGSNEFVQLNDRGDFIATFYDETERINNICNILDEVTQKETS